MKKTIMSFLEAALIFVLIMFFCGILLSCGDYTKPKVASHVLAVTLEGDTILVAIDKIRPNMYNSYYPIYSNPYYYNYYPRTYNYQWRYNDNRGSSSSSNNNNNPVKVPVTPDITTRPPSEVLMKGKK
tara:strand:- start:491 stop:874 length:384 start_codon:yes stop_codon:yes gene_type:complete